MTTSFLFQNMGRIGLDSTDNSQRSMQNTRFANYQFSNFFSENRMEDTVQFACQQPLVNCDATSVGLSGKVVDYESVLMLKVDQERPLEKLQLFQRPFITVPYLGRGSGDPEVESKLQQGELLSEKKSVSTVMDKSFLPYTMYPTDDKMEKRVQDPQYSVEEAAMSGWVRGGVSTRELPEKGSSSHASW
jgi:hypothetical protein